MTTTQRILARALAALVVGVAALGAATAQAADCVGFTDVVDDGPTGFCPSVEWIEEPQRHVGLRRHHVLPQQSREPPRDGRVHEASR